jgi:hypothetical protein
MKGKLMLEHGFFKSFWTAFVFMSVLVAVSLMALLRQGNVSAEPNGAEIQGGDIDITYNLTQYQCPKHGIVTSKYTLACYDGDEQVEPTVNYCHKCCYDAYVKMFADYGACVVTKIE